MAKFGYMILPAQDGFRWSVHRGSKTYRSGTAETWRKAKEAVEEAIEELKASGEGERE